MSGKANILISASIRDINFEFIKGEPATSKHNNDFEEKGVPKVVYATYTPYGKTAYTKIEGTVTITDLETGKVLKSDSVTGSGRWRHEWGTYTGDERALSKRQKNKAKNKDEPFPHKTKLVKDAIATSFMQQLNSHALAFAKECGK